MKKIYLFIFTIFTFLLMGNVSANTINKIDINIKLDENGNANITETWDVDGSDGTEWYKGMNNLGNSELTDFKVSMDGTPLKYKKWNINESLNEKKGYYGINYTSNGQELCFGKYDYNRHTFTLNYNLSNFVINTDDSQVLYWKLIDSLSNVDFKDFSVTVSGHYEYPDDLDVWGYGKYGAPCYVHDGVIEMTSDGVLNSDEYLTILVKFPKEEFYEQLFKYDQRGASGWILQG